MPAVEVAHRPVLLGEQRAIVVRRDVAEFEANECQSVFGQERLDDGNRRAAFLHVKKKVAAFAGGEESVEAGDAASGEASKSWRQRRISAGLVP